MDRLRDWLTDGMLITDGAWGTELQARGLPPGTNPDPWNLSHAAQVEAVARAYVDAGSQVILTNTFRANAIAMPEVAEAELDAINRAGVAISRRAAGQGLVFASIGPGGRALGFTSRADVAAAFAAQARSLAAAGADALLVETMSDLEEARVAVEAACLTGLPVVVSFTFGSGESQDRTLTGATPEEMAEAMTAAGADSFGANCGTGIEQAVRLCRRLRAASDVPLWIKPSAGLPIREGASIRYDTSAELFASHYAALRDAGAAFLGGCCGSTPEFIRALVDAKQDAA